MGKSKTQRLLFNKENADQLVSFIILQAMTVGTIALRLPLISANSSIPILASFLFWGGLIPISQLLSLGRVNRARVKSVQKSIDKCHRNSRHFEVVGSIVMLALFAFPYFFEVSDAALNLVGVPIFIACFGITFYCSEALGIVQGLGKNPKVNYVLAVSALFSLGLTWIGYEFGLAKASHSVQVSFLVEVTVFAATAGYLYSFHLVRNELERKTYNKPSKIHFFQKIQSDFSELLFSMPPVLFTAFDLIFLSAFSNNFQILQYGFYSRCAVLASILPAALYLPLTNKLTGQKSTSMYKDLKPAGVLTLANLPFIFAFAFLGPLFANYLSSGITTSSIELVFAFISVAILQPLWIVLQSHLSDKSGVRASIASRILFIVLPLSVFSSWLGAFIFGASGAVAATAVSYLAAILVSLPAYKRKYGGH
jgi:hypothetical protein